MSKAFSLAAGALLASGCRSLPPSYDLLHYGIQEQRLIGQHTMYYGRLPIELGREDGWFIPIEWYVCLVGRRVREGSKTEYLYPDVERIPEEDRKQALETLVGELQKFEPRVLEKTLGEIYLVSSLTVGGKGKCGVADRFGRLCLDYHRPEGFVPLYSDRLYRRYKRHFPKREWRKAGHSKDFRRDFVQICKQLDRDPAALYEKARKDAKTRRWVELAIQFHQWIIDRFGGRRNYFVEQWESVQN